MHDISTTMNQTEAFKLMMREKEALIAEKYQLTDKVNTLRKQAKTAEEKWQREKEALDNTVSEKSAAFDELKKGNERLESEVARLKVFFLISVSSLSSSSSSSSNIFNS